MAITTHIAPVYGGQKIFTALLCAVFGVWGGYDYFVKIPAQEVVHQRFNDATARKDELEARFTKYLEDHTPVPQAEQDEFAQVQTTLKEISPGGAAPVKPSKFNRATQWVYMSCLPFAPWFFWMYLKSKQQKYVLDDEGTLHFAGDKQHGEGAWPQDEIADIDMSKWMAKSIAHAVHKDGRRLLLDAYIHKNLHLIIGAIASRFYPEQWDDQAKMVKGNPDDEPPAPLPPEDEDADEMVSDEATR